MHYMLEYPNFTIIPYNEKCRYDMIFMVLEAKDAIGRIPWLNENLTDVHNNYIDAGDMFWLAIDGNDRVIGCAAYLRSPLSNRNMDSPSLREILQSQAG